MVNLHVQHVLSLCRDKTQQFIVNLYDVRSVTLQGLNTIIFFIINLYVCSVTLQGPNTFFFRKPVLCMFCDWAETKHNILS